MMRRWLLGIGLTLWLAPPAMAAEEPKVAPERIVLHTSLGDLVLALYPDVAPGHVAQIERLARLGVYDGTSVYRLDPSFMIQLSGAHTRSGALTAEQTAAIHPLTAEFSGLSHRRGRLSMAHEDNEPNSAQTSFIIVLADSPHLDGRYTVFGHLEGGEETLDAMLRVPRRSDGQPQQPIMIEQAEVVESVEALRQLPQRAPIARPSGIAGLPLERRRLAFWFSGLVIVGLFGFLAAGRALPRSAGSFALLGVLAGAFALLIVLAPHTPASPPLASAVFLGLLGVFKLLSWFERPPS
jgi:cyclophilin family peptidyl-prolyl cis-trans isomerase